MKITIINTFSNKQAAMFGLDARIALAIFGALSVITGAALYSVVNEATMRAKVTEWDEITKAVEAYMLDTGKDLLDSVPDATNMARDASYLRLDYSVAGWKGPYYPETIAECNVDPSTAFKCMYFAKDSNWDPGPGASRQDCTSGDACYYWLSLKRVVGDNSENMKKLDLFIDGVDSPSLGKFRYIVGANTDAYYQGPLTLKRF